MDNDCGWPAWCSLGSRALLWQRWRRLGLGSSNSTITNVNTGASFTNSGSSTNTGWLAGAGVEWAFLPNWSAKVEYDFLGLNNSSFTVPSNSPVLPNDNFTISKHNISMVMGGINYKFGPWW
jgi:outer membrane immunogenic protein